MKMVKEKNYLFFFLLIFLINFLIRLPNISFPNSPVFDEAHFSTYAAAYALHKPHLDIHPPLGKILYAVPLFFLSRDTYGNTAFIEYKIPESKEESIYKEKEIPYGTFPYIPLRLLSIFFGSFLIGSIYLFMRSLTGKNTPALLSAALLTFDNSLILETKLILLNGIFLAFGFFGLWLLLKRKWILASFFIACSFFAKFIGIFFIISALLLIKTKFQEKKERKKIFTFSCISFFSTIFLFVLIQNFWILPRDQYELFKKTITPELPVFLEKNSFTTLISEEIVQGVFSLGGYTVNGGISENISHWYSWPFMIGVFPYTYFGSGPPLLLMGNWIVWGIGTASILILLFRFIYFFKKNRKVVFSPEAILLILYLSYLALFAFLVQRSTFLYHYFPALIISVCIFSIIFSSFIEKKSRKIEITSYCVLIISVIICFLFISPYTYGFLLHF